MVLLLVTAVTLVLATSIVFGVVLAGTPAPPLRVVEHNKNRGAPLAMDGRRHGCFLELGRDVATGRPYLLDELTRHKGMLIAGPVGVGKTTMLQNQMRQDIQRGAAVVMFDSQRALHDDVQAICAASGRLDELVIYPDDGCNPLNGPGTASERAELVADLLGQITGTPRPGTPAAHYLLQAQLFCRKILPLYERAYGQPMTLRELYVLASQEQARLQLVADAGVCPATVAYAETLGRWTRAEWEHNTAHLRGLIDALLVGDRAWQYTQRHAPTLYGHLEAGRVVLIQEGGPPGTTDYILGQLFVIALQEWARKRVIQEPPPHTVALYLDEAPNYLNAKTPFFINQCRQKRVAMVLGFQAFDQLAPHTNAITTGARTWLVYGGLLYDDCVTVADQIGKRLHEVRTRARADWASGNAPVSYQDRYLMAPHVIHNLPSDHVVVLSVTGREVDGYRLIQLPAFARPPLAAPLPGRPALPREVPPTVWEERGLPLATPATKGTKSAPAAAGGGSARRTTSRGGADTGKAAPPPTPPAFSFLDGHDRTS